MLTPNQIKNHTFQYTRGGYKASDVDTYLDEITQSYEQMFKENGELLSKLELLAKKLEEYREDEDKIKLALITAQKAADSITTEARTQAEQVLTSSKNEADELLKTARAKADMLVLDASRNSSNTLQEAENKANEVIEGAKLVADNVISQAKQASEEIVSQAKLDVKINQEILNELKEEASAFRSELLEKYKMHIEHINEIPDLAVKRVNSLAEAAQSQPPEIRIETQEYAAKELQETAEEEPEPVFEEISSDCAEEPAGPDGDEISVTVTAGLKETADEALDDVGPALDANPTISFVIDQDELADTAASVDKTSIPGFKRTELKFGEDYNIDDDDDQYNYEEDLPPEEPPASEERGFKGIFRKK